MKNKAFHLTSFLAAIFLCGSSVFSWGQDYNRELIDGIAAIVNEGVVTISEVREVIGGRERALQETYHGAELEQKLEDLRKSAIRDLIDRQLILQEFHSKKFTIPPYVVDEQVKRIIVEEFGGDRAAFIRTLQSQGFTLTRFKRMEMDKVIVMAMRQENIRDSFIVSPRKIQAYYDNNRSSYATPTQVKLRMIILREGEDTSDLATNAGSTKKKMAEEIRSRLMNGADFDRMARMYSEDASTQEIGGDWGWIDEGTLNPTLSEVAFSLKPGEISSVISMGTAYYILTVEGRKNASVKTIDEVRSEIERDLIQQERIHAQDRWMETLRKRAYIKILT